MVILPPKQLRLPVLFTPIQFLNYYANQLNLPQDKLNEGTTCTAQLNHISVRQKQKYCHQYITQL